MTVNIMTGVGPPSWWAARESVLGVHPPVVPVDTEVRSSLWRVVELPSSVVIAGDRDAAAKVWMEFLYHGEAHGHAGSGVMTMPGAVGTVTFTDTAVWCHVTRGARQLTVDIWLAPWRESLPDPDDVLREPYPEGWSAPWELDLPSGVLLIGDCDLLSEGSPGVLIDAAGAQRVTGSVLTVDRWRRVLRLVAHRV